MSSPKIVAFAGSLRAASFNKKLLAIGVEAARADGAEVTVVDLRELALPLFDGDIEDATGLPEGAKRFKALLRASDGMLIASPEYNSSITGALKNAIDWASRTETDDEPALVAFRGKAAALLAASPGALGGLRGLVTVRSILSNIGVHVLPDQVCIPVAYEAFDEAGKLKDEKRAKQVARLVKGLVDFAARLKS
jgi:chromate reductase